MQDKEQQPLNLKLAKVLGLETKHLCRFTLTVDPIHLPIIQAVYILSDGNELDLTTKTFEVSCINHAI